MNPIRRFNVWFDKIREPKRFLIFLALFLAWYAPLNLGEMYDSTLLKTIGVVGLVLMVAVALDRCGWFNPRTSKPEDRQ